MLLKQSSGTPLLKPSCATDVRHALRLNGDYPKQVSLQWRIQAFREGGPHFGLKITGGVPPLALFLDLPLVSQNKQSLDI